MVVRQGMAVVLVGVAVDFAAALGLTRRMASFLFEVSATDPVTFAAIPLLLGAIALAASWLPARRASRVEPVRALSVE